MGTGILVNGVLKHGAKIGNATVVSNRLEKKGYAVPNIKLQPSFITIHDVGDYDVKGINWYNALHNANKEGWRKASWHITVDVDTIYQSVNLLQVAWHAGDGEYGTGNRKSIGIEHVVYSDKSKMKKVYENGAALVQIIMDAYGIPLRNVVQHNTWTGKDCPNNLRHNRSGYDWNDYIDMISKASKNNKEEKATYIKIIKSCYAREKADWNAKRVMKLEKGTVLTKIKKVDAENGKTDMYLTKAGIYVSASSNYTKEIQL